MYANLNPEHLEMPTVEKQSYSSRYFEIIKSYRDGIYMDNVAEFKMVEALDEITDLDP
mgnify:CR=1 FL=1